MGSSVCSEGPQSSQLEKVTFAACAKFKEAGQEERAKATALERPL